MTLLSIAAVLFLFAHLGISSTPLRGVLVGALGEGAYLGVYSLLAAITLGFLVYAYAIAPHTDFLWYPGEALYKIAKAVMFLSAILLAMGLFTRNPTSVGMDAAVGGDLDGIFKIVRHPVQWAFILWAIAHILANGDVATLILSVTIGFLSSVGIVAIDSKRRNRDDAAWQDFYATTSAIPFVAIATGKTSLSLRELNWMAIGVGIVLYVALYFLHGYIAGVHLVTF